MAILTVRKGNDLNFEVQILRGGKLVKDGSLGGNITLVFTSPYGEYRPEPVDGPGNKFFWGGEAQEFCATYTARLKVTGMDGVRECADICPAFKIVPCSSMDRDGDGTPELIVLTFDLDRPENSGVTAGPPPLTLAARVDMLENEVAALRAEIARLEAEAGIPIE